ARHASDHPEEIAGQQRRQQAEHESAHAVAEMAQELIARRELDRLLKDDGQARKLGSAGAHTGSTDHPGHRDDGAPEYRLEQRSDKWRHRTPRSRTKLFRACSVPLEAEHAPNSSSGACSLLAHRCPLFAGARVTLARRPVGSMCRICDRTASECAMRSAKASMDKALQRAENARGSLDCLQAAALSGPSGPRSAAAAPPPGLSAPQPARFRPRWMWYRTGSPSS